MDYETLFADEQPKVNREEYAAKKKEQRDELWNTTNEAIAEIFTSTDSLMGYLEVCAKFHNYSINNKAIIAATMPFATQLKSYADWQKEGIQVRKNEKSFSIWRKQEGSDDKSYVNPYPVFDITQTDSEVAPPAKSRPDIDTLLKAFGKNSGKFFGISYRIVGDSNFAHLEPDEDISFDGESTIYARPVINKETMLANLVEETVYVISGRNNGHYSDAESITAICAAFVLCKMYGMGVSFSLDGLEELFPVPDSGKDLKAAAKEIKLQLEEIDKYVGIIDRHISLNMKDLSRER